MQNTISGAAGTVTAGFEALTALVVAYTLSVVGAVLLLVAGYFIAGLVERAVHRGLGTVRGFDLTLRQFFSKIARYAVLALVGVMVLGQFGVQTASIIAAIGAVGLAIGLALQGTLQNIAAGIMLLALRPFRAGEYVEVGSVAGTIEEIGLFATRMRTFDGIYVLAPNSKLWNEPVRNLSRNNVRRTEISVGIGYSDDIDLAQKTMRELVERDDRVWKDPAPMVFVSELGDSAVGVTVRYWTSGDDFFTTKTDLTKLVKTTFDQRGLSIPFPQTEVTSRPAANAPAIGVDGRAD